MIDEERINPQHLQVRGILRLIGPLLMVTGATLVLIGMVSFFSSFGTFQSPRFFWCCFAGMPLLAVGGMLTKFGYMGAIMRYQAGEIAPVGKDTFDYMASETQEGVQTVAKAFGAGMRAGLGTDAAPGPIGCPSCGRENDSYAKFCNECGQPMRKQCDGCGVSNDTDARFCHQCGDRLLD